MKSKKVRPVSISTVIGQNLVRFRDSAGLSQRELGEKIGPYLKTGKPWIRQAVWVAEQGGRDYNAAELLALAVVTGQPVARFLLPESPQTPISVGPPGDPVVLNQPITELVLPPSMAPYATGHELVHHLKAELDRARDTAKRLEAILNRFERQGARRG